MALTPAISLLLPLAAPPPPPPPPPAAGKPFTILRSTANATAAAAAATSAPAVHSFEGRPAITSPDGRYELRWDSFFRSLTFKDSAAGQVLWSAVVKAPPVPPVRLLLSASGELVLQDYTGQSLWSSGTKGVGRPPHMLQMLDGSLLVADGLGATTWLAGASATGASASMTGIICPSGTRLQPWQQCGGTECAAGSPFACRDAQWQGTCCPAGWYCYRKTAAAWRCQPTTALDRCSGSRSVPPGNPCGGSSVCGADSMCSNGLCCAAGSVCQRISSARWDCVALPKQPVLQGTPPAGTGAAAVQSKAPPPRGGAASLQG
jgi:hypothetical protein